MSSGNAPVRLRPGERPTWWNAALDSAHFDSWRATAAVYGVAVDAVVAVLLEFDLVLVDLDGAVPAADRFLHAALNDSAAIRRLPPVTVRGWLDPPAASSPLDELPELLLPERLAARLSPGTSLQPRLHFDQLELALACDRRAAEAGRTLESWALHNAVRHNSGVWLGGVPTAVTRCAVDSSRAALAPQGQSQQPPAGGC